MRTIKTIAFLFICVVVALVHMALVSVEPEFARDIALQQFESSDAPVQQLRAYQVGKGYMFSVVDLLIPCSFIVLFGWDIYEYFKKLGEPK